MVSNESTAPRRDVTAHAVGVRANLTCYGFHVWAEDFLAAARAYAPVAREASFVGHFLCCQSLELSLKAFLSMKGLTRQQLMRKPFGHNLAALLDAAIANGVAEFVEVTPADIAVVARATDWYDTPKGKRLQYFDLLDAMSAFKGAPDATMLQVLAMRFQSPELRKALLNA
jgi:hypothetical protein